MENTELRDASGMRVRLGLDPLMIMEAEGDDAAAEVAAEVEAPAAEEVAEVVAEEIVEEAEAAPEVIEDPAEIEVEAPAEVVEPAVEVEAEDETDEADELEIPEFEDLEAANAEVARLTKNNVNLHRENAKRRVEGKQEGETSEFESGWSAIGELLESDPEAGISVLQDMIAQATAQPEVPLTREEIAATVGAVFDQRQEQLAVEAAKQQVRLEIEGLGYSPDATADTAPEEYARHRLLWDYIAAQPEGDRSVARAHEQVQAFAQSLLDGKLAELAAANTGLPVATGGAASSAATKKTDEQSNEPRTPGDIIKEADAKTIAFYESRKGASNPVIG